MRLRSVQPHRIGHHVVADIADEHERAAGQGDLATTGPLEGAVRVQAALQRLAALLEAGGEVPAHEAEPVAVHGDLVIGIHRRDGVLGIHDGGEGGFQHEIGDAGGVGTADLVAAVDHDLQMQAVLRQQDGGRLGLAAEIAAELRGVLQPEAGAAVLQHAQRAVLHAVGRGEGVAAGLQRRGGVQHGAGARDDGGAASGVVAAGARAFLRDGIGAVEGVVQAAPARIGGIQCVAGVVHGHDELRPGEAGDLVIHVPGGDLERRRRVQQVADAAQEGLIGLPVHRAGGVGAVPFVDAVLEGVAFGQQVGVARAEAAQGLLHGRPEGRGLHPGAGKGFFLDEAAKDGRDLHSLTCSGHAASLLCVPGQISPPCPSGKRLG
jgi:hypothetical protein